MSVSVCVQCSCEYSPVQCKFEPICVHHPFIWIHQQWVFREFSFGFLFSTIAIAFITENDLQSVNQLHLSTWFIDTYFVVHCSLYTPFMFNLLLKATNDLTEYLAMSDLFDVWKILFNALYNETQFSISAFHSTNVHIRMEKKSCNWMNDNRIEWNVMKTLFSQVNTLFDFKMKLFD